MNLVSLPAAALEPFLERRKAAQYALSPGIDLDIFLEEILHKAHDFVPSEAGSILLDDPLSKNRDRLKNELVFIASFGDKADALLGRRIPASAGIVGHVYRTGQPYVSSDAVRDPLFFSAIDHELGHHSSSILCVPISIETHVCGVLELVNRRGAAGYAHEDRDLLEIFAGYISTSIQNVLDGRRARDAARRDDLTGLANDRWLHEKLCEEIAAAQQESTDIAVIFFDLDHFKKVNDTYGHLAGSQVLREVGALLRETVQRPGATLCRYGGDEFVLILPGLGIERGVELGETIRAAIKENAFLAQNPASGETLPPLRGWLSCSMGIATLRRHVEPGESLARTKDELLRRADAAMYRSKELGKNCLSVAE